MTPLLRVLVGDKESGPIEFEFETLGIVSGRGGQRRATEMVGQGADGEEEEEVAARVDSDDNEAAAGETTGQAEQFDSRVTVCKPVSSQDLTGG